MIIENKEFYMSTNKDCSTAGQAKRDLKNRLKKRKNVMRQVGEIEVYKVYARAYMARVKVEYI